MHFLIFLLALLSTGPASAWGLLEPNEVTMEGFQIEDKRDPYWDNLLTKSSEAWSYGAAAHINFDVIRFDDFAIYWKNRFHMASTKSQVRETGWEWEFGLNVADKIELFTYHHSQHYLDYRYTGDGKGKKFPLYNWYGFRFVLYRRD